MWPLLCFFLHLTAVAVILHFLLHFPVLHFLSFFIAVTWLITASFSSEKSVSFLFPSAIAICFLLYPGIVIHILIYKIIYCYMYRNRYRNMYIGICFRRKRLLDKKIFMRNCAQHALWQRKK